MMATSVRSATMTMLPSMVYRSHLSPTKPIKSTPESHNVQILSTVLPPSMFIDLSTNFKIKESRKWRTAYPGSQYRPPNSQVLNFGRARPGRSKKPTRV